VEFLVDENLNYYFLEMNTRLQVEHPVTEMITGIDLVEQQIRVARGEKLSFRQEDLKINGHAVELRVYAEDPLNDFLPSIGKLATYRPPAGEGIRVDDGFRKGMDIPIYYDPMLSKLIAWGRDRSQAIQRLLDAIANYEIEGADTTLSFGKFVLQHEAFVSGRFDTHFVKNFFTKAALEKEDLETQKVASAMALKLYLMAGKQLKEPATTPSDWRYR
jgi:propionyl-CoA carboxylase alpha chain